MTYLSCDPTPQESGTAAPAGSKSNFAPKTPRSRYISEEDGSASEAGPADLPLQTRAAGPGRP
eukprot:5354740-Pyramimonas_sp.AAC.1